MLEKVYTVDEVRAIMKKFGLTHQWLADQTGVTRGAITMALTTNKWKVSRAKLMLWTYILNDYIQNELEIELGKTLAKLL